MKVVVGERVARSGNGRTDDGHAPADGNGRRRQSLDVVWGDDFPGIGFGSRFGRCGAGRDRFRWCGCFGGRPGDSVDVGGVVAGFEILVDAGFAGEVVDGRLAGGLGRMYL